MSRFGGAAVFMALIVGGSANAAPIGFLFDSLNESKTSSSPLNSGGGYGIDGLIGEQGSVVNSFTFTAGNTAAVSINTAWVVTPLPQRLVGVNVELLDTFNNLLASDQFAPPLVGGQAFSSLIYNGLTAGAAYTVQLTGTAQGVGRYQMGIAAPIVGLQKVPIAAAPANVPVSTTFDTKIGEKTVIDQLLAGETLRLESDVAAETVPSPGVDQLYHFTVGETRDFAASLEWVITGTQRTTGLNADLFDSSNNLVASDSFIGSTNGQAFSQFDALLAPGDYTLEVTAFAANASRWRFDLASGGEPPVFVPIEGVPVVAVPEPVALSVIGLGMLGLVAIRRRPAWRRAA